MEIDWLMAFSLTDSRVDLLVIYSAGWMNMDILKDSSCFILLCSTEKHAFLRNQKIRFQHRCTGSQHCEFMPYDSQQYLDLQDLSLCSGTLATTIGRCFENKVDASFDLFGIGMVGRDMEDISFSPREGQFQGGLHLILRNSLPSKKVF